MYLNHTITCQIKDTPMHKVQCYFKAVFEVKNTCPTVVHREIECVVSATLYETCSEEAVSKYLIETLRYVCRISEGLFRY
jgi:hypothetical protein